MPEAGGAGGGGIKKVVYEVELDFSKARRQHKEFSKEAERELDASTGRSAKQKQKQEERERRDRQRIVERDARAGMQREDRERENRRRKEMRALRSDMQERGRLQQQETRRQETEERQTQSRAQRSERQRIRDQIRTTKGVGIAEGRRMTYDPAQGTWVTDRQRRDRAQRSQTRADRLRRTGAFVGGAAVGGGATLGGIALSMAFQSFGQLQGFRRSVAPALGIGTGRETQRAISGSLDEGARLGFMPEEVPGLAAISARATGTRRPTTLMRAMRARNLGAGEAGDILGAIRTGGTAGSGDEQFSKMMAGAVHTALETGRQGEFFRSAVQIMRQRGQVMAGVVTPVEATAELGALRRRANGRGLAGFAEPARLAANVMQFEQSIRGAQGDTRARTLLALGADRIGEYEAEKRMEGAGFDVKRDISRYHMRYGGAKGGAYALKRHYGIPLGIGEELVPLYAQAETEREFQSMKGKMAPVTAKYLETEAHGAVTRGEMFDVGREPQRTLKSIRAVSKGGKNSVARGIEDIQDMVAEARDTVFNWFREIRAAFRQPLSATGPAAVRGKTTKEVMKNARKDEKKQVDELARGDVLGLRDMFDPLGLLTGQTQAERMAQGKKNIQASVATQAAAQGLQDISGAKSPLKMTPARQTFIEIIREALQDALPNLQHRKLVTDMVHEVVRGITSDPSYEKFMKFESKPQVHFHINMKPPAQ